MQVIVDTSVWIDYFESGDNSSDLDILIDENLVCTNDLILTELIPFLEHKEQKSIVNMLNEVRKFTLRIDWKEIQQYQFGCLKQGMNGVGIPDLMIAQNVRQNNCLLYSFDKHFRLLQDVIELKLYNSLIL